MRDKLSRMARLEEKFPAPSIKPEGVKAAEREYKRLLSAMTGEERSRTEELTQKLIERRAEEADAGSANHSDPFPEDAPEEIELREIESAAWERLDSMTPEPHHSKCEANVRSGNPKT